MLGPVDRRVGGDVDHGVATAFPDRPIDLSGLGDISVFAREPKDFHAIKTAKPAEFVTDLSVRAEDEQTAQRREENHQLVHLGVAADENRPQHVVDAPDHETAERRQTEAARLLLGREERIEDATNAVGGNPHHEILNADFDINNVRQMRLAEEMR